MLPDTLNDTVAGRLRKLLTRDLRRAGTVAERIGDFPGQVCHQSVDLGQGVADAFVHPTDGGFHRGYPVGNLLHFPNQIGSLDGTNGELQTAEGGGHLVHRPGHTLKLGNVEFGAHPGILGKEITSYQHRTPF